MQLEGDLHELIMLFFQIAGKSGVTCLHFRNNIVKWSTVFFNSFKAERTGNWDFYTSALVSLTPLFFSMDRPNYAQWLPVYVS